MPRIIVALVQWLDVSGFLPLDGEARSYTLRHIDTLDSRDHHVNEVSRLSYEGNLSEYAVAGSGKV